jgi:hypothetical protein
MSTVGKNIHVYNTSEGSKNIIGGEAIQNWGLIHTDVREIMRPEWVRFSLAI